MRPGPLTSESIHTITALSWRGVPIVLKLYTEDEQTEDNVRGYEELLAASEGTANSGECLIKCGSPTQGEEQCWDTDD